MYKKKTRVNTNSKKWNLKEKEVEYSTSLKCGESWHRTRLPFLFTKTFTLLDHFGNSPPTPKLTKTSRFPKRANAEPNERLIKIDFIASICKIFLLFNHLSTTTTKTSFK